MTAPLILTVQLDEQSQQFFNEQRAKYFPPERNYLQAHLTLFHHLPNGSVVMDTIESYCSQQQTMVLAITDVVSLGKGVAYKVENRQLIHLHKSLQQGWRSFLTPQDAQGLWPHITLQNKVTATVAQNTLQELKDKFAPFTAHGVGLLLWKYLNGPWELYRKFSFTG